MDMDMMEHRREGGFPTEKPTEALRKDHHFARQLIDCYLNTQDENVKKEAGPQLLLLLEMHDAVEESIFYPRVKELDSSLIQHFDEVHQQARDMLHQLKSMRPDDPQCDGLFRQLAEAFLAHVEEEEQQLFPKVEQSNLDLTKIGIEMQAFEASMVSDQARASAQSSLRQ